MALLLYAPYITDIGITSKRLVNVVFRSTFLSKSQAIYSSKRWIISTILFHIIPGQVVFWAIMFSSYFPPGTMNEALEEMHASYKFTQNITSKFSCVILLQSKMSAFICFILICIICAAYALTGFILQVMSFYRLRQIGITPSRNVVKLQKQLLFALVLQVLFCFVIIAWFFGFAPLSLSRYVTVWKDSSAPYPRIFACTSTLYKRGDHGGFLTKNFFDEK